MLFSQIKQITILFRFLPKGKKNFFCVAAILLVTLLASLLEGGSFASIFFAFSYLHNYKLFALFVMGAIGLQVLRSGLTYLSQLVSSSLGVTIQRRVQEGIFTHIFGLSYAAFTKRKMGDLMEISISPTKFVRQVMDASNRLLVAALMALGYILIMSYLSLPLTASILLLFSVAILLQKYLLKRVAVASEKQTKREVLLSAEAAQNLEGMREIHLFHCHKRVLAAISHSLGKLAHSSYKLELWRHLILPINEILSVVLVGLTILLGLYFLQGSTLPLTSALLTYMTLTYRMGTRLQAMMQASTELLYYSGSTKRGLRFVSFTEAAEPKKELLLWHFLTLDNVGFTYSTKKVPVLQDLSLTINKGEVVAFVGASGAGKSTLLDLLLRLYEPTEGHIYLDNRDVQELSLASYRSLFAVVSQDGFLFHSSIKENITFGHEKSDLAAIISAAKQAYAHEFIMRLPEGYDTVIGERGQRISGGERQRIALARALYRTSDILVLDEATSHLDALSEQFIQKSIAELKGKKTIIMVAHRESTLRCADRILTVEKGQVIPISSHKVADGRLFLSSTERK